MTLLIDTGSVPARQRVEFWSDASCDIYHPLAIRSDAREQFSARMWGDQVGSIGLYRIAASRNTMTRTPKAIAAGDPECLHLSVLLRGHMKIAQQSRADLIAPGDMTAYDTSQPATMRADEPFEALVLQMPRAMLGEYASRIAGLTALRIPGDGGLPRLAAQFFRGVAAGVAAGTIDRRDTNVAERVIDLARGLYADHLDATQGGRPRSRTELLLRAKGFIDANLGDPALCPEQVARACFISKRYLHRLFEDEGLSVCDFVRAARLDRCRRDLLDPAYGDETILTIASRWGLPSAPHFSRLFRAAYGCSPRHLRCGGPA